MHWRAERRRPPAVSVRVGPLDPQRRSDQAAIVAGICIIVCLMMIVGAVSLGYRP